MYRLFFTAMGISFLGALPLGTLNVTAMQLSVNEGVGPAMAFSLGALLVEMGYTRLSLVAIGWVRRHEKMVRALEWISIAVIAALAVGSFIAALHPSTGQNPILRNGLPRFLLGLLMSAVNPLQIPFWFGWSSVLFDRKILKPERGYYNIYLAGIGFGTFTGHIVFIFGGRFFAGILSLHMQLFNGIIGVLFALTGILQLVKALKGPPGPVRS